MGSGSKLESVVANGLKMDDPHDNKLSAEMMDRIMDERAVELAREPDEAVAAGSLLKIVEFSLAHEKFGIELSFVREVFPLKTLTPIPCTPSFVQGVTNLRGEVLSVIDLKRFFDLPDVGLTDSSKVIVLHSPTMEFGILADAVIGTLSIPREEIQPPPPTMTGVREEYLEGITRERVAILDAQMILADEKIVVDSKK